MIPEVRSYDPVAFKMERSQDGPWAEGWQVASVSFSVKPYDAMDCCLGASFQVPSP